MPRGSMAVVAALARRPGLWPTAIRAGRTLVPRSWWRRRPFLPLPDPRWLHFRLETAYGRDGDQPLDPEGVLTWLTWQQRFP